jgi:transcriptional regulator with XRE-family HTH domain
MTVRVVGELHRAFSCSHQDALWANLLPVSGYPGTGNTTRAELGAFLRSRRARLSADALGLGGRARRRTPGLRREEVADLAGVSPTWYTWLEQGRPIRVSDEVLAGIARALRLEPAERAHLYRLAGRAPPATAPGAAAVSPRLQGVLDHWDPFPAHVGGRRRDVLAWNRASEALHGWSRLPDDRRNVLWWVFMVPSTRRLVVDWELNAERAVAALRAEAGGDLGDPDYQLLVSELLAGSLDFAAIWARQDVRYRQEELHRFDHPELGRLEFEFVPLRVAEERTLRLYLHIPGDERTERALRVATAATGWTGQ